MNDDEAMRMNEYLAKVQIAVYFLRCFEVKRRRRNNNNNDNNNKIFYIIISCSGPF